MAIDDAVAVELRTLREVTERNHKETTEQISKLVSSERHELVTRSLEEADRRNEDDIKEVRTELATYKATADQNARQIRTIWLTAIIGAVVTLAFGLIAKATGFL